MLMVLCVAALCAGTVSATASPGNPGTVNPRTFVECSNPTASAVGQVLPCMWDGPYAANWYPAYRDTAENSYYLTAANGVPQRVSNAVLCDNIPAEGSPTCRYPDQMHRWYSASSDRDIVMTVSTSIHADELIDVPETGANVTPPVVDAPLAEPVEFDGTAVSPDGLPNSTLAFDPYYYVGDQLCNSIYCGPRKNTNHRNNLAAWQLTYIQSSNNLWRVYQGSRTAGCRLVLQHKGGDNIWGTAWTSPNQLGCLTGSTTSFGLAQMVFQPDGNAVIYGWTDIPNNPLKPARWSSHTQYCAALNSTMKIQTDGNLVIRRADNGVALWSRLTGSIPVNLVRFPSMSQCAG